MDNREIQKMIVKDLWRAWKEVRKKRKEAELALINVELLLKEIKEERNKAKECYELIGKVYHGLPEIDRQDYVQKTLDLLHFTGSGWIKQTTYSFYDRLWKEYSDGSEINIAYQFWKNGDYDNVVKVCLDLETEIKNEIKKWINQKKNV